MLIVGLLQAAGVDSGVAMVWINDAGHESNNGHAVAVARLADGTDLVVDASFPDPFADQAGLVVADASGGYCFVRPVYSGHRLYVYGRRRYAGSRFIRSYRSSKGTGEIRVRMLDIPFLRSQFDYYRGERAPGGFTAKEKTPAGLAASARFLERAVRICPQNPLPVYVLGRVYARQGKLSLAKAQIVRGHALYERFGFVPRGPREAYAEVTGTGAVERKR